MTAATLSIENLHIVTRDAHGHDHALVCGLDLTLQRGRVTALVGTSGSGKSLTCGGVLGVLPRGVRRVRGEVRADGRLCPPGSLAGRLVGTIVQNPRTAFNPVMSMRAHLDETLRALAPDRAADQRIVAMMEAVGLQDPARILPLRPFEMSGGMLQRMMIVLALLAEPPFLFADEPTTDLDMLVQAQVLDLIEQVTRARNMGVLLITHDLGVVARLADEVAVIAEGRIVETAPVDHIFNAPAHGATRALLRAHMDLYGEAFA